MTIWTNNNNNNNTQWRRDWNKKVSLRAPTGKGLTFEVAEWREGTFAPNDGDDQNPSAVVFCAPYRVYRRGTPPMQERIVRVVNEDVLKLSGCENLGDGILRLLGESWLIPFYAGRPDFDEAISLNRPSASVPGHSTAKARPSKAWSARAASSSVSSHLEPTSSRSSSGTD